MLGKGAWRGRCTFPCRASSSSTKWVSKQQRANLQRAKSTCRSPHAGSKLCPLPEAGGFWCNGDLALLAHPSDPQHCTPVPAFVQPISRGRTSCLCLSDYLQIQLLTSPLFVCLTAKTTKYVKAFSMQGGRILKRHPFAGAVELQGWHRWGPRYPVLSRTLCRTCTGFLKTSGTELEQHLLGQLTRTHSTYQQSVFMQDAVTRNLWTPIAEQNVLYMHCSCNHLEVQNKHGAPKCRCAPEGNLMFENKSVLTLITCWTSCFASRLMKLQMSGFLGKQGSCKLPRVHCTKSILLLLK